MAPSPVNPSVALRSLPTSPADFSKTLAGLRGQIDARLNQLLPPPDDASDQIGAALHEGVLAPGKRLRPLLVMLVGRSLGQRSAGLLDLACAVEMVHAASLFLDDMPCMDNARLRRGRPAVHVRYGQDVAMLGAVALLAQACGIAASVDGIPGERRAQLVKVMCDAVGLRGLVRGQYRDLREGWTARPLEDIASANQQKTGALFSAGFEMAALAAGADQATRAALRTAANELGQAFQLRDDLEDRSAITPASTKDRNQDAGKSTMLALLGQEAVQQRLAAHLAQAETQLCLALPADPSVMWLVRTAFGLPPDSPAKDGACLDAQREFQGAMARRGTGVEIGAGGFAMSPQA